MIENKPEIILLYFALGKLGAVSVPVNTAAKGELLAYYLVQSDSELLIADANLVERVDAVAARVPKLRSLISLDETGDKATVMIDGDIARSTYAELLQSSGAPRSEEVRFSDVHSLIYTSGTTGPSKGNISTHCHSLTCGYDRRRRRLSRRLRLVRQPADLPWQRLALQRAAGLRRGRRRRGLAAVLRFELLVRRPSLWRDPIQRARRDDEFHLEPPPDARDRDHKVRQVMVVPTPAAVLSSLPRALRDRVHIGLRAHGLRDCDHEGSQDPPEKWASAGKACPHVQLRVVDDDDFELPAGAVGEIVVRNKTPWVHAQGYYNMPEATAGGAAIFGSIRRPRLPRRRRLHLLRRPQEGCYPPTRRKHFLVQVEQLILKHSAVLEVAAFPVTSEHSEDEVMVSVVPREGAIP